MLETIVETLNHIDGQMLLWLHEVLRNPFLTAVFTFITKLGDGGMIWIVISLGLTIPKKTRKVGITGLCALLGSLLINNMILKNLVARTRPFDTWDYIVPLIARPNGLSFPSGHTASSFACAWVLFRKLPKKYGIPAVVLAGLIAFSRLYLGVHYPLDVIAGIVSGILISLLADFIVSRCYKEKTKLSK